MLLIDGNGFADGGEDGSSCSRRHRWQYKKRTEKARGASKNRKYRSKWCDRIQPMAVDGVRGEQGVKWTALKVWSDFQNTT